MSILKIQCQTMLLTWSTHVAKEWLVEHIRQLCEQWGVVTCTIAHESADETDPYEHTHCVLRLKTAMRKQGMNAGHFFCLPCGFELPVGKCPASSCPNHLKFNFKALPGRGTKAWKDGLKYILKEDPVARAEATKIIEDLDGQLSISNTVCAFRPNEAMKYLGDATEENIISRRAVVDSGLFEHLTKINKLPPVIAPLVYDWQKQLATYVWANKASSDRSIHVIHDRHGGSGKTKWCQWAEANGNIDDEYSVLWLANCGRATDMLNIIVAEYAHNGWDCSVCLISIPRDAGECVGLFHYMEQLKDQLLVAPKYNSRRVRLEKSPVIILFCNHIPDLSKLSDDRWQLWEIDRNTLDHQHPGLTQEYQDAVNASCSVELSSTWNFGDLGPFKLRDVQSPTTAWRYYDYVIRPLSLAEALAIREGERCAQWGGRYERLADVIPGSGLTTNF